MGNIIFGAIMLIGGLSGKLALRGTHSSTAIAVVGGVLILWGILRLTVFKPDEE